MDKRTMISIRGGMFETVVAEAGSGDPLLYLHGEDGPPGSAFLDALATRYRVTAPTHPGFGASTGSENLLDLPDLIYYYLDLLDALDLRGAHLVGHGLGGMFAAELAAVQPDRFRRLVLIAPFGLWNAAYPTLDLFAAAPPELAAAQYHDPTSPAAVAAATIPDAGEPYVQFMLGRARSMATAAKYLWPIPNRGLVKRLHRVRQPTLLVWGESDGVVPPRYAPDFQHQIADSRTVILERAGHLPQVEQPAALASAVLAFLAEG